MSDNEGDSEKHLVLVNHEEQYSLWLEYVPIPKGWREVKSGTKKECLEYVRDVWTDMRPLSLRKKMGQKEKESLSSSSTNGSAPSA